MKTQKEKHIKAHTVEAQVFRLLDVEGRERGRFETKGDQAIFTLLSPLENGPSIALVTGLDGQYGYAEMRVTDRSTVQVTKHRKIDLSKTEYTPVVLGLHPGTSKIGEYNANPFLELSGLTEFSQARLSISETEHATFEITDILGEERINIGTWGGHGKPEIRLHSPESDENLSLNAEGISKMTPDGNSVQYANFGRVMKVGGKEHQQEGADKEAKKKRYRKAFKVADERSIETEKERVEYLNGITVR